jgi:hypothetical protein
MKPYPPSWATKQEIDEWNAQWDHPFRDFLTIAAVLVLPVLALAKITEPKITPPQQPVHIVDKALPPHATKGGRWYMAQDGHAVFCYGPTMLIPTATGDLTKVVTFCRGDKTIVPLHD